MPASSPPEAPLDPLLHQTVRTRLVAYLAARGQTSFKELKQAIGVSDGNLESHLKKLIGADYIQVEKRTGKGRTQSLYELTNSGNEALKTYIASLNRLFSSE